MNINMYVSTPKLGSNDDQNDKLDQLTTQERRILALAMQDLTCKEMAARLGISSETAQKHRKNILRKLNIKGKVAFRKELRNIERFLKQGELPERYP